VRFHPLFRFSAVLSLLALSAVVAPLGRSAESEEAALPPPADRPVDFANDVEPILHERCYLCHGPSQQMSGFRLDLKAKALEGGYSGPAIQPGDSASSLLIQKVSAADPKLRMPPVGEPLSRQQTGILRAWIDQGAEWPDEPKAPPLSEEQRDTLRTQHWAFRPIQRPEPPAVRSEEWVRNPIDRFILAKLEAEGVEPAPEADKYTLIRRVSLDLTGLPPAPAEIRDFVNDGSEDAYEKLVERLLESPHYGEKWAQHWLDVARYADSDGYEKDLSRPWAWRWRHWVINALNEDMPFDEFTKLQIAGDLLPGATVEDKVATGFHRNTLRNREGGTKYGQTRFEETVDRASTAGMVWLGLTVECAQCHDHKYDPISQRDFYSLYAFFDNVRDIHINAPLPGELGPYLHKRDEYLARRQELLEEYKVTGLQPAWERKMKLAGENPGKWTDWDLCYDVLFQMTDGGWEVLYKNPEQRTFREKEMLADYFIEWYWTVVPKERYEELKFKELQKKLRQLKESYPQLSQARIIQERKEPKTTRLRVRGQWDREGVAVAPGVPAFLPSLEKGDERPNRLDLAEWLVSPDNPLTARVAVNRMWQALFSRGVVVTSEDFGSQGAAPSHPELLDWLAAEFISRGWSMKQMHKLIVLSAAYRQSSQARPELSERDPDNAWVGRQNRVRLPAELIRDAALQASGLLYTKVGGPSVFPPQPDGVAELTYAWDADRWQDSAGKDRYRRGTYTFFQRTAPYPQLINFDAPGGVKAVSRRRTSNTPLQALNLLNDEVFVEAAQALAARVLIEAPEDWDRRLDYAYLLCLSRKPTEAERQAMRKSFDRHKAILDRNPESIRKLVLSDLPGEQPLQIAAWVGMGRVLMNLDEFITRE